MRLNIQHRTTYTYTPEAAQVALRLRLYPTKHDSQTPGDWSVAVNGTQVEPLFTDGFGDQHALWHAKGNCDVLEVTAAGVVETAETSGILSGLPRRPPTGVFLRDTALTAGTTQLQELAESARGSTELERMHALSSIVADAITYRAGDTDAATSAAEALELGSGVCQDYAHVMIAAARALEIPARYVSGYMIAHDDAEALHETHAWVEVFVSDLGWIGFDPSNNICPTERYVRLCCGLDANSAAPIRGSVSGSADVTLDVNVAIGEAERPDQQQSQGQNQGQQ